MHHPTDRILHTTAFVKPVVEHWLEREIAQWVHPMKDRSVDPSHHERTLLPRSYISLPRKRKATSSLGKMIGMVRLRTSFILSSQSWEIGSPPTGGAGRMKLSCVVPASVIHIWSSTSVWALPTAGFLSRYLSGHLPYVRRHITVNKMCWVRR